MVITPEFWSALAAIIVIDLVLAGDNAIVIALAARNLPKDAAAPRHLWGTVGAVVVRASLTVAVLWLLRDPRPDARRRHPARLDRLPPACRQRDGREHDVAPAKSFWGAMRTIVIADAVMGLDNVLAVAGAAHGSVLLVVPAW